MEAKIEENHDKNASQNHIFFACVFVSILERFGEGFGRVLGGVWELLGVSWGTFKSFFLSFVAKRAQEAAKRSLGLDFGVPGPRFWRVLGLK